MNDERIENFIEEVGQLKSRGSNAGRERWLFFLGCGALIVGVGLALFGGLQASGTTVAADQWAYLATGSLLGLAFVGAGAALFVRFSLARFLRFWLVRLVHEHRSETDRVVAALERIESRLGPVQNHPDTE